MIHEVAFAPTDNETFSPLSSLVEWLAPVGTKVEPGQPLFLYETDKAIATFFSPVAGHVRRIMTADASRFSKGTVLALLSDSPNEPLESDASPSPPPDAPDAFDWNEIDNRDGEPEPLSVMRRTIALRMAMSKRHIPCFYLTVAVDMTAAKNRRAAMRRSIGKAATFNDMAIKASALALAGNPVAAAVFTPEGLVRRREINIGFAAALPDNGLVVPVVRRADRKPLAAIVSETRELAERAAEGKLTPADCAGGVFSVSYLGAYDVDEFAAIVNPGEAAIAAIGRTVDTPMIVDGRIAVRPVARITLSCDHRSIDGALAARLAGDIKRHLEHAEEL